MRNLYLEKIANADDLKIGTAGKVGRAVGRGWLEAAGGTLVGSMAGTAIGKSPKAGKIGMVAGQATGWGHGMYASLKNTKKHNNAVDSLKKTAQAQNPYLSKVAEIIDGEGYRD